MEYVVDIVIKSFCGLSIIDRNRVEGVVNLLSRQKMHALTGFYIAVRFLDVC